tara:strand:- start:7381 stop:8352 length:972 start_codon:yes stop_codon:yes gene_type:complete
MFPNVSKTGKNEKKRVKKGYYNYCECCDYIASQKSHWDRHILTKKHIKKAFPSVSKPFPKTSKKRVKSYICEHCGEEYKNRSGLWKHKKKCEYINDLEEEEEEEEKTPANNTGVFLTTEQLHLLLNHKTMGDNNTNCNNTYNNNITVQVYLDDHCKDAKTIEEIGKKLLSSIQSKLKLNDIVYKSNSQFIKDAPSELFIKEINKMSAEERPVHCADGKRGKFWVNKEKEGWVKEDVNEGGTLKQKINDFKTRVYGNCVVELYDKVVEEDRSFSEKESAIQQKIHHELIEKNIVDNNIIAKLATNCNIKDAIKDIESQENGLKN